MIKIGLTKRQPDVRAREIYEGASGVPLPFDIAVAYSVGDCKRAEKIIHKRLAAFRINNRREFFRSSPQVAATIVYETCSKLNVELGLPQPDSFEITTPAHDPVEGRPAAELNYFPKSDYGDVFWEDLRKLKDSPLGTSVLSPGQVDRITIVSLQLGQVFPDERQTWLDSFTRDSNPESEIRVWENITKAYLTIEEVEFASDALKREAFALLLMRSLAPVAEVLERCSLRHFSTKSAKRLLRAYEMKPKPLVVSIEKTLAWATPAGWA